MFRGRSELFDTRSSTMQHVNCANRSLVLFVVVILLLLPLKAVVKGQRLADLNFGPHLLRSILNDDNDLLTMNLMADVSNLLFNPTSEKYTPFSIDNKIFVDPPLFSLSPFIQDYETSARVTTT